MAGPRPALMILGLCVSLSSGCERFSALGPQGCDSEHGCKDPARPRCDLLTNRCLKKEAEGGDAGSDGAARGQACKVHADCESTLCDEFGVTQAAPGLCVPPTQVAVVRTGEELSAALSDKSGVRLLEGTYHRGAAGGWQVLRSVILIGPAAVNRPSRPALVPVAILTTQQEGPVVRVGNEAQLVLDGLSVQGGKGSSGHGIYGEAADSKLWLRRVQVTANEGRGVWARCPLFMDQSVVGPWIGQSGRGNLGGGIWAEAETILMNSFVIRNGTAYSSFGGIALSTKDPTAIVRRQLAQLTLVGNFSMGSGNAIHCNDAHSEVFQSLFFDNQTQGSAIIWGLCQMGASATDDADAGGKDSVYLSMDEPPRFVGADDLHLLRDSPAVDRVPLLEDGPRLDHDFDGEVRPFGKARDFGADEVIY